MSDVLIIGQKRGRSSGALFLPIYNQDAICQQNDTAVFFWNQITCWWFTLIKFGWKFAKRWLSPDKPSWSEVLLISKPLKIYNNPVSFDGTDLWRILLGNSKFFPIVDKFCYLGCKISHDCKDKFWNCRSRSRLKIWHYQKKV